MSPKPDDAATMGDAIKVLADLCRAHGAPGAGKRLIYAINLLHLVAPPEGRQAIEENVRQLLASLYEVESFATVTEALKRAVRDRPEILELIRKTREGR